MKRSFATYALLASAFSLAGSLFAQNEIMGMPKNAEERKRALADKQTALPREMENVGIDEKLGQKIDLNLTFVGEDGRVHPLRDYFASGRPVILNLVYFKCPMLCNLTLNGQVSVLRELAWKPGKEFDVVTISIDPMETYEMGRDKKAAYMSNFDQPVAQGWHFLADHQGNVKKLAAQIGFRYRFDERQNQFAHSAAIMVLSPQGMVSRYLYGIKFRERDLRLALTEAAQDKFGLTVEKVLLMCFHYDPSAKSYVLFATNFMRFGGVMVVLVLGTVLFRFWRKEFLAQAPHASGTLATGSPSGDRN